MPKYDVSNAQYLDTPEALPAGARLIDGLGMPRPVTVAVDAAAAAAANNHNYLESIKIVKGDERMRVNSTSLPRFLADGWMVENP